MSGKNNVTEAAEAQKVMTKYDRKIQQRKLEAENARKEEIRGTIIGIVLVVALAAFVLSFPIRSYLAVNGTYIKVGGEKVTRLEFGMQYNTTKNTYIEQMGPYLSMFGMTDATNLEYQAYSDDLTFGDYFEQLTAEGLVEQKGIKAKAKEAGFTYDTKAEIEKMKTAMETAATEAGVSFDQYLQATYGSLATWKRVVPYLEDALYVSAYYNQVLQDNMPSEEAIQAEYEANKDTYDSVDYHYITVNAELPTTAPDGTVQKDEEGNEIPYEPTEEEVAAAMKKAYQEAQKLEKTVATEGEVYTGVATTYLNSNLKEFMLDESRKPGDTTIVEVAASNRYLVASFDARYRKETPTYDIRMIYSASADAQTILDEWKAGAATEESFVELVAKYDEMGMGAAGGLYSGMEASDLDAAIEEWLLEERTAGDTFAVKTEQEESYVIYYVGENEPTWKLNATASLVNAAMTAFVEDATANIEIVDKKKELAYLYVEEDASEESTESAE